MLQQSTNIKMVKKIILLGFCLVLMGINLFAQSDSKNMKYWFKKGTYFSEDSSKVIFFFTRRTICKGYFWDSINFKLPTQEVGIFLKEYVPVSAPIKPVPLLQLHGNIAYTFDYRSQLDTPFKATNLQQHNEQIYADATLKGKYPFRVIITSRQSNSPYFKNYTDLNIQFNHQQYQQLLRQSMIADLRTKVNVEDSVRKYEAIVNKKRIEYDLIKNWLDGAALKQQIVQEKEILYQKYLQSIKAAEDLSIRNLSTYPNGSTHFSADSLQRYQINTNKDSILAMLKAPTSLEKLMRSEEKKMDSINGIVKKLLHVSDSVKMGVEKLIAEESNKIKSAQSINELESIVKKNNLNSLSKTDKKFLAITQLGIGRTVVNYSDLTVNNISLSGLNVEYNPSFYAAFAAGSVDYLFRDFIVNPGHMLKQNLLLGRYGWGTKENRIIILTAYTGTKNSFGGRSTDTVLMQPSVNSYGIFGYSLETKYKIGQHSEASLEYAKSSSASKGNPNKKDNFGQAFNFLDHSNEAISGKINISIPSSGAAVNMYYKLIGANFNSFSIYNSGIRQVAWGIKWKQYFFSNKLSFTAQVKKSSFEDQLIPLSYNSSSIFKSIQAVYRKRKWPVISMGYMPSTQLVKNTSNYIFQNVYYALTGSLFYNYSMFKLRMNSSLVYNRFFNKGTDSGFVLYNAKSIQYSHLIDLNKWHTQTDFQFTKQPLLTYWTFQQKLDVRIGKTLVVGAGVKNSLIPASSQTYWGGSALISLQIRQLGGLRIQYDKGYFPNGIGGLVPNNWGRITWNRIF